ncbi:MAG TPA: glycogen debranching protein GlgX [Deltaproteobacteria bacterium]|mgnify:CR=1 FL=1|nr:glycogen debranching protein GlgX [Deltaproteobacteria bacterium]
MKRGDLQPGRCHPLGATVYPNGVNFSLFSRSCYGVELLFFDGPDDAQPSRIVRLDPRTNKTFHYWHCFVPGIVPGQLYGYRVHGAFDPGRGLLYDGRKLLLDPYAKAVALGRNYDRSAGCRPGDNTGHAAKAVVVDPSGYDWEGDEPLRSDYATSVIYELHVGGFTRHPSSGVAPARRGTYAGLVEKIGYLKELGITAVELMPVQQFDVQDAPPGLRNYWGYSPMAFFAPHSGYSSAADPLLAMDEFRDMVKALHRAGIEVIMDVVFNHTAEAGHEGPTQSFRGLENTTYYIYDLVHRRYENYSGCGNTVNTNHSVVRRMISECLRYWVEHMHVDGFRFDLASVMARGESGEPLERPPILWSIESDPVLAGTKIIAEAWDAAGLYQVGSFIGERFAEWNGQFRDDVRRFVKGDRSEVFRLTNRILGSPDIYPQPDRETNRSINFVTCHDGFTLNDLVSYNAKHNEANAEQNRDGSDYNFSWNCGVEGPSSSRAMEALRLRQIKNFLAILFISQGTPMLLMGDEVRRTQHGNNNAYCQDNETSWFDWDAIRQHGDLLRFVQGLIRFSRSYSVFNLSHIPRQPYTDGDAQVTWHGVRQKRPDLGDESRSVACELKSRLDSEHVFIMISAFWEPLAFELPRCDAGYAWHRVVDTSLRPGEDYCQPGRAPRITGRRYLLRDRCVAVLVARRVKAPRTGTNDRT